MPLPASKSKSVTGRVDIPVFHDDQHGTAIVVAAAMINALKVVKKKWEDIEIVINGAGAAGISIAQLLLRFKPKNIILVNLQGALVEGMERMNPAQAEMVKVTNHNKEKGKLETLSRGKTSLSAYPFPVC